MTNAELVLMTLLAEFERGNKANQTIIASLENWLKAAAKGAV